MAIGVIFDLDGTLLDTLEDLTDSVNFALSQYGFPPRTWEEVRRFLGDGAEMLIRRAADNAPNRAEILRTFRARYREHCHDKTRPYNGIPEAVAVLGRRYPVAVVSNKPDNAVKMLCKKYFDGIYACGESPDCPRKPDPAMVRQAMAAIGVEQCVYVGDSEVDIATARNARVGCLSVLWGYRNEQQLLQAGAKRLCGAPEELPFGIERVIEDYYGK